MRVTRFLLKRYNHATRAAPLAELPVFQGEAVHGRARALLSQGQQRGRLQRIAQINRESPPDALTLLHFKWQENMEELLWREAQLQAQLQAQRRKRYETRRERGYW